MKRFFVCVLCLVLAAGCLAGCDSRYFELISKDEKIMGEEISSLKDYKRISYELAFTLPDTISSLDFIGVCLYVNNTPNYHDNSIITSINPRYESDIPGNSLFEKGDTLQISIKITYNYKTDMTPRNMSISVFYLTNEDTIKYDFSSDTFVKVGFYIKNYIGDSAKDEAFNMCLERIKKVSFKLI